MKLLHPFMPFITEEIWQHLPHEGASIMISDWPRYSDALNFADAEADMTRIMNAIKSIRNTRTEMNIAPSKKCHITIATDLEAVFNQGVLFFEKLASASGVTVKKGATVENAVSVVVDGATVFLPLDELVDKEKEIERLTKEKQTLLSEIKRVEGKLGNAGFVAKAPAAVVEEERKKGEKYKEMLAKVEESLAALQ